jgi:hypothetical protein
VPASGKTYSIYENFTKANLTWRHKQADRIPSKSVYILYAFGWILWGRHVALGSVQYPHSRIRYSHSTARYIILITGLTNFWRNCKNPKVQHYEQRFQKMKQISTLSKFDFIMLNYCEVQVHGQINLLSSGSLFQLADNIWVTCSPANEISSIYFFLNYTFT